MSLANRDPLFNKCHDDDGGNAAGQLRPFGCDTRGLEGAGHHKPVPYPEARVRAGQQRAGSDWTRQDWVWQDPGLCTACHREDHEGKLLFLFLLSHLSDTTTMRRRMQMVLRSMRNFVPNLLLLHQSPEPVPFA